MRIKFSIRTYMLLIFAVSASLAIAVILVQRVSRQREAIAIIQNHNGAVAFDNELGWELMAGGNPFKYRTFGFYHHLTRSVTVVRIDSAELDDSVITAISTLKSVELIYLKGRISRNQSNAAIQKKLPHIAVECSI